MTSARYHDQLQSPLKTAIHWIEHVAKTNGAPHLRSVAVDLPLYQLYNLDCLAFVLIAVYFVLITIRAILQIAISFICHKSTSKVKKS